MIYILNGAGTSKGWGKPLAVFDNKADLKEYLYKKHKKQYPESIDIEVKTLQDKESIDLKVKSKSLHKGYDIVTSYEVFIFQSLNPTIGSGANFNFFDE